MLTNTQLTKLNYLVERLVEARCDYAKFGKDYDVARQAQSDYTAYVLSLNTVS